MKRRDFVGAVSAGAVCGLRAAAAPQIDPATI
jgi:hypothetical protein